MCRGTVGDSHETAERGQVRLAGVSGQADARAGLQHVARITVVGDVDDLQMLQGMAHHEVGARVLPDGEAFTLGRVAKGEVTRLGVQGQGRKQHKGDGEDTGKNLHGMVIFTCLTTINNKKARKDTHFF